MEPSRHGPPLPDRPGLTWLSQVRLPESGACGQPERKDRGGDGPAELAAGRWVDDHRAARPTTGVDRMPE
jgi:hypothetical protein